MRSLKVADGARDLVRGENPEPGGKLGGQRHAEGHRFAMHQPVRRRIDAKRLPEADRVLEPAPNQRRACRTVAVSQHPDRNLRLVAEERTAQHPLPGPEHLDDVAGARLDIDNVGAINPRVATA